MNNRNAFLLTTDPTSERTIFSHKTLKNIGFNVIDVNHIPQQDKVLSNKLSMQSIYSQIVEQNLHYAYVFEDDINILDNIGLEEIIQYEQISPMFFYLGLCENYRRSTVEKTDHIINSHEVYSISKNVRGLHAIGLSYQGAKELLELSKTTHERYMDMILEDFSGIYRANIVRYDLESYIPGHRGVIFKDRNAFPTTI